MDSYIVLLFTIILGAALGYFNRFLTISGSLAAGGVGLLTVLGLHMKGLFLLGVFFATSSLWSKYKRVQKSKVEERHAKGSRRDWQQVVANGGSAAAACFLYFLHPDPVWIFGFCILIASSNSDTWASEIGTLSLKSPISIRTLKVVEKGTSGAISLLGTLAGMAGSLLIALLSYFLFPMSYSTALLIFIFGLLGNFIDTMMGAYIQAVYRCKKCDLETEKISHCNQRTEKIRGFTILNNDVVNFLSSLIAAILGIMLYSYLK